MYSCGLLAFPHILLVLFDHASTVHASVGPRTLKTSPADVIHQIETEYQVLRVLPTLGGSGPLNLFSVHSTRHYQEVPEHFLNRKEWCYYLQYVQNGYLRKDIIYNSEYFSTNQILKPEQMFVISIKTLGRH